MSKVGAVVVAYNPDHKILELIESLGDQFNEIIIVNNGMNGVVDARDILKLNSSIKIIDMYGNRGVASALNRGIERAGQLGMQYITTFDQDSRIPQNFTTLMLSSFHELSLMGHDVGIICPIYRDLNSGELSARIVFNKLTFERRRGCERGIEKVTMAITSGSFMPMSLFSRSGKFIEDMFIDYVDNEFCLRLKTLEIEIFTNMNIVMEHSLGERTKHTVGRFHIFPSNHSPMRKYYISRNRVYCVRRYGLKNPSFVIFELLATSKDFIRVIVFEKQKIRKVKSVLRGLCEGLKFKPSWEYK